MVEIARINIKQGLNMIVFLHHNVQKFLLRQWFQQDVDTMFKASFLGFVPHYATIEMTLAHHGDQHKMALRPLR